MKVYVHSSHLLTLESLEQLLSRTNAIVAVEKADVAIRDLRTQSAPLPAPFPVPTLALLDSQGDQGAIEALRAGYRGYLHSHQGSRVLLLALAALQRGENWAERHVLAEALMPGVRFRLTPRESQVHALLLAGKSNAAIAEALGISVNTVKSHVSRILYEFGAAHRSELVYLARVGAERGR